MNEKKSWKLTKWHFLGLLMTLAGIGLFAYFLSSVGIDSILGGISKIGVSGFAAIIILYSLKILTRAKAWSLCLEKPYKIGVVEAFKAVVIGEAMSAMIPLGILVSGTAKAFAVRHKVPLLEGLSSLATENLFYSLATALLIIGGATAFLVEFSLSWEIRLAGVFIIAAVLLILAFGILAVVRQWHFASGAAEWLYRRGFLTNYLESGRADIKHFEDNIYSFYRRHPRKFLPVLALEIIFHLLGITEVWLILSFITQNLPSFFTAFLLETVNRLILLVFKLIPFVVGVDEAGAQMITTNLGIGAAIGVSLAIIRKGRVIFWTLCGVALIVARGISISEIFGHHEILRERGEQESVNRDISS